MSFLDFNDNGQIDPFEAGIGMSMFYGIGAMLSAEEEREEERRKAEREAERRQAEGQASDRDRRGQSYSSYYSITPGYDDDFDDFDEDFDDDDYDNVGYDNDDDYDCDNFDDDNDGHRKTSKIRSDLEKYFDDNYEYFDYGQYILDHPGEDPEDVIIQVAVFKAALSEGE